ncbi:MAG: HtrA protease/chaperone protein [Gemmatimonadetes bacterium]|nr:HtrA protease/chaperone protein [Gemmatimonadota bacterium]
MHSRKVCSRAVIALGVFASVLSAPLAAQAKGYTLDDILGLLRRHVASTRVLSLAKTSCVTFQVTDDVATRVKRAGGTQALVDGLKQVCNPNSPAGDSATKIASGAVPIPKAADPPPVPVDTSITVRLRAAVVGSDLTVRALPQLDLWIISPRGDTTRVSTDLEGRVERTFRPGVYRIESPQPYELNGARYRWGLYQTFQKDAGTIELTQKNAQVETVVVTTTATMANNAAAARDSAAKDSASKVPPPKKIRTEKELFDDYKSGLFTVYGSQRGTGFLADSSGLVLTNAHLLDGADEVRVMLDSNTKVYARRLVVDPAHDLAVLAIPARRCAKCTPLPMYDSAKTTLPSAGDRVLALGSPFNKAGVLSTGIVSNADQQSITSEVSLGYLNTGGPLLNTDGYVVGLNAYRPPSSVGAGRISNSVAAPVLASALQRARDSLTAARFKPVSDSLLPVVPREPFPSEPIAAVSGLGATLDLHNYRAEIGPFRVFMMTPQVMAWRETQAVKALADRKRSDPKKAGGWTAVDPIEGWRDWSDYLGDRRAVVVFNVTSDKTAFPFYEADKLQGIDEGSLRDMKIYRDGVEIIPIEKVRIPAMLNVDQTKAAGKTVAMQGIYVYRVEDFAPRAVGTTAAYTITLVDAAKPAQPYKAPLLAGMIEQMWKDFTAYRFGRR